MKRQPYSMFGIVGIGVKQLVKIALLALNSSYIHTNLAVRSIRDSLTSAGYGADIFEYNIKDRRGAILSALYREAADIYGFSSCIWNISQMLSIADDLKKLRPESTIVFGGPEVSYNAEELLAKYSFIDHIITGEGEYAFIRLAEAAGKSKLPPVIDGGMCDSFESSGIHYDADGRRLTGRILYYESSRGCPYKCAYCLSSLTQRIRAKPAEKTLRDLLKFESLPYEVNIVKFVDRTFNFNRMRAKEIWRGLLSPEYTKRYHFEICAELLDEESFELLASFPRGKIQLEIGVQSTNPETLRRIHRSLDTEGLLGAISRLHSFGNMRIHADLIAGLPGEDLNSFARSFDSLYGRCDILQLGFLKLLHGTELRREAEAFGCVYSNEPPYTVLATDCLSFDELELLHQVDDLLERYVNSHVFDRSVELVTSRVDSPFALLAEFAEKSAEYELPLRQISQTDAFKRFYECLHDGEDVELAIRLILDFLTSQNASPPPIGGLDCLRLSDNDKKHAFFDWCAGMNIDYFAPSVEVWQVGGSEYYIDRRNHSAYEKTNNTFVKI